MFLFAVFIIVQVYCIEINTITKNLINQIISESDSRYDSEDFKQFIKNNEDYGYNGKLNDIRRNDFSRGKGEVYLDYTGSGIYRDSQIVKYLNDLTENFYGNSHSMNPSSFKTTKTVESVRNSILSFFHTNSDEYTVIFTSGATGALKLVGETFPWSSDSEYKYLQENHNSVLGIREMCSENKCKCKDYKLNKGNVVYDSELLKGTAPKKQKKAISTSNTFNLFAYPAEDNFAGVKYPLEWIEMCHNNQLFGDDKNGKWKVLLDAAAYAPTATLNLTKYKPDYVALSFYKMFGYPTGLGALIVHNSMVPLMNKRYFGGGSVLFASEDTNYCIYSDESCSKFEDGTINFLNIASLKYGLEMLQEIGMDRISKHVYSLTRYLYNELVEMKHTNGKPLVEIYGNHYLNSSDSQGGIVSFNLLYPDGSYNGYYGFQMKSAKNHIHVRTGCHCNPGACHRYIGVGSDLFKKYLSLSKICGDRNDVIDGMATGAIRVSLGYLTNFADITELLNLISEYIE